jgi:hypothetical protein
MDFRTSKLGIFRVLESAERVYVCAVNNNDVLKAGFLRLLSIGGEAVDASGAAKLYGGQHGCTEEVVLKAAQQRRVIAVRDGNGRWHFPVWQFNARGKTLPGIPEIVRILRKRRSCDDLSVISFFVNPSSALNGRAPYEHLQEKGQATVSAVKKLAEAQAE